ncbi:hypothetical protein BGW36DRAFT_396585 [Talaromyces proteolyticus]|uniref:MYND-type domain-containing protein n=1 Tax=Talaromyces proteolyticus TaxID=1131652 RepID=A0AAD4KXG6_9EURO|nr:uncharacterized protein BGW36DRAFT_396585 [Talaromyces proteolyticus]KAH8698962.1 hypothetical protein BGW36DRAFT_396585 [Talaromyces proteolyticus]
MTATGFICANWGLEQTACKKEGRYTCKNCCLIIYCGPICQKSHWSHHKIECKSTVGKKTWQPAWVLEKRTPAFIRTGIGVTLGAEKYLWGNVSAIDIVKLGSNEGDRYAGDLRLLFAASGDLRNVVKTISYLPSSYKHSLQVTINDRDFDIMARNVILLLVALVVEKSEDATDCIIHLWYSAVVRELDIEILHNRIRPLIEDKPSGSLLAKTWTFGRCSLRIALKQSSWNHLLNLFNKPAGLTAEQAQRIRAANTLARSRRDYRDRYMSCLSPIQRICFNKFRQDGLLLPFGFPRHDFREPNPTFFQTADTWPMKDNADPLHGWSFEEVLNTTSGAATADIYGKLYFHIRELLHSFFHRISSSKISFQLLNLEASSLPDHLDSDSFSRIDVSNISDRGWLGIHRTLHLMVPLLQTPLQNPHATLITLFMNAVDETLTDGDKMKELTLHSRATKYLLRYRPPNGTKSSEYDAALIKFTVGRELVTPYDHIFDRFVKDFEFHKAGEIFGATMKEKHTIIEKWPYRLKLRPGQPGAQDEFDRCMRQGVSGKERYVEWKRIHRGIL